MLEKEVLEIEKSSESLFRGLDNLSWELLFPIIWKCSTFPERDSTFFFKEFIRGNEEALRKVKEFFCLNVIPLKMVDKFQSHLLGLEKKFAIEKESLSLYFDEDKERIEAGWYEGGYLPISHQVLKEHLRTLPCWDEVDRAWTEVFSQTYDYPIKRGDWDWAVAKKFLFYKLLRERKFKKNLKPQELFQQELERLKKRLGNPACRLKRGCLKKISRLVHWLIIHGVREFCKNALFPNSP